MSESPGRIASPAWCEPVFDRVEADMERTLFSLPVSTVFEVGSGFGRILLTGRQHTDSFRMRGRKVRTTTDRSGGIQGGISNGAPIFFRVAFKPTATLMHPQATVIKDFKKTTLKGRG